MTWYAKRQPIYDDELVNLLRHYGADEAAITWCLRYIHHDCDLTQVDGRVAARWAVRAWREAQKEKQNETR